MGWFLLASDPMIRALWAGVCVVAACSFDSAGAGSHAPTQQATSGDPRPGDEGPGADGMVASSSWDRDPDGAGAGASASGGNDEVDDASHDGGGATTGASDDTHDPNDPNNPLRDLGDIEHVQGDFTNTEGPLWLSDVGEGVLLFTDLGEGTVYMLEAGVAIPIDFPADFANGLVRLGDTIFMCEQRGRRVSQTTLPDFTRAVPVAESYEGEAFNAPNDIAVRRDGTIYFTDPMYGAAGDPSAIRGVYRVSRGGSVSLVTADLDSPNGIALSPDESTLYVTNTQSGELFALAVSDDGSTSAPMLLALVGSVADGMTVDAAGNLFVGTWNGVTAWTPEGMSWGTIAVPEVPSNVTFGDPDLRTLYITARTGLYRVRLNTTGIAN